jgi:hypothetical protein
MCVCYIIITKKSYKKIGLDQWKKEVKSPDYDWELIKARLDQLREIRRSNKGQSAMIFALRSSLARNLGDMGNSKVRCLVRYQCITISNHLN